MENRNLIKRYLLLNIYLNRWKPGEKILSAQQIAIKFNVSLSTVKKELIDFKKNNILTTRLRKGFFVNKNLYKQTPFSIAKKYGFICHETKFKNKNILIKKYGNEKNKSLIWSESQLILKKLINLDYIEEETFLYNLAWNGIVIIRIKIEFEIKEINNVK
ncbi:MAG: GntR family transcriptional regulator [Mycoplasmatales bacterium]|nr:GntR family transcriptional regulator [Mycoplasmatales bacterium]